MSQPLLFDDYDDPPSQRHSDTSRAAAEAIEPTADTLRRLVLDHLRSRGDEGSTDEEMQRQIPMQPNTQRPRRVELTQAGFVRDSGRRRRTLAGRQAVVWVAT